MSSQDWKLTMTSLHNLVQTSQRDVVPGSAALCLPSRIALTVNNFDRQLSLLTIIAIPALLKNGESFRCLVPLVPPRFRMPTVPAASAWNHRSLFEAEFNHHPMVICSSELLHATPQFQDITRDGYFPSHRLSILYPRRCSCARLPSSQTQQTRTDLPKTAITSATNDRDHRRIDHRSDQVASISRYKIHHTKTRFHEEIRTYLLKITICIRRPREMKTTRDSR
jgi:hypothetical protein